MNVATLARALTVLSLKSVRDAATFLEQPTSSVADALEQLESLIALQLTYMMKSKISLTPAGEELYSRLPEFIKLFKNFLFKLSYNKINTDNNILYHSARFPLSLSYLERFIVIVDNGSIQSSALILNVPQPSLSRQVRQAEERLGYELLQRSGKGCLPTEDGLKFYWASHAIIQKIHSLTSHAGKRFAQANRGIRFGTIMPISHESNLTAYLSHLLSRWHILYPGQNLSMECKSAGDLLYDLQSSHFDIIITDTMVSDNSLENRLIFSSEIVIAGKKNTFSQNFNLSDILSSHPIAVPSLKSGLRLKIIQALEDELPAGLGDSTTVEVDALPVMLRLIMDNDYLSFVPLEIIKKLSLHMSWVHLSKKPKITFYMIWKKNPRAIDAAERIYNILQPVLN